MPSTAASPLGSVTLICTPTQLCPSATLHDGSQRYDRVATTGPSGSPRSGSDWNPGVVTPASGADWFVLSRPLRLPHATRGTTTSIQASFMGRADIAARPRRATAKVGPPDRAIP